MLRRVLIARLDQKVARLQRSVRYLETRIKNLSGILMISVSTEDLNQKLVYDFVREYKLASYINREESGIRRPSNFIVLGHSFTSVYKKGSEGQYPLIVRKSSWEELRENASMQPRKTLPCSFADRLRRLKLVYQGWINNDRLSNIHSKLKQVDEWLINRLRYCI